MPLRMGLSPLNEPAQVKVWHWTEPTTALLTSDVTRSDVQAARPPKTVTATMPVRRSCLIIGTPSCDPLQIERSAGILVDLGRSFVNVWGFPSSEDSPRPRG